MRKLFIVALISLFVLEMTGVVMAAGNTGPGYPGDIMGMKTGRQVYQPHRTFRLVHWGDLDDSTTGLAANTVVYWETSKDSGVSICRRSASGDSRVAGILVTAVNSQDSGFTRSLRLASEDAGFSKPWGWLQTYGSALATCNTIGGITAGDSICGIGGAISRYISNDASMLQMGRLGFAMDDIAVGVEGEIFLKIK